MRDITDAYLDFLLSKRRVCVISYDGKSPNTRQWYLASHDLSIAQPVV
jgi:hypothetical protein